MNPPYSYPPPGLVYFYPPHPPPHAPPGPSQYGPPPGLTLNGHPNHPHPQYHTYGGPRPPQGVPFPGQNYHVDAHGWYTPQNSQQPPQSLPVQSPTAPLHPPGLALPKRAPPPVSAEIPSRSAVGVSDMNEFWAGRLAPLPGHQSRPILLPMKGGGATDNLSIPKKPDPASSPLELLPPHSFFGSSYERNPSSISATSEKPVNGEKKDKKGALGRNPSRSPTQTKKQEKEENQKNEFVLDKYAESFVPQYLYNIQREPHPLKPLPAIPVFPSVTYLNSFLITRLIKESQTPSLLLGTPIPADEKPAPLDVPTYREHWGDVLRWELDAVARDKEQIVLWKREMKVAGWKDAEFVFSVPGIRENYPFLEVGDLVHLREVLVEQKSGSKRALEARVSALRKQEGLVYIHSPPLKEHVQTYVPLSLSNIKTENGFVVFGTGENVPFAFNISFMTNARPLCTMQAAVDSVARILSSQMSGMNLARQWIFPEVDDFTDRPGVMLRNGVITEAQWEDPGLNAEQRLAVTSVSLYQLPVPRLISGPPGTGKTRTVVESVLQIFRVQPEACILLCAPSNPATDTLVLRLQKTLLQHEMLRLNDPNRTFAEVPDQILQYCYIEDNKFSLPPWKQLMRYRVVVTSCLDAAILVRAHCTNVTLMAMESEVTAPLHPHHLPKHVVQPHWTHLLIDEAAQGSEPELLIPIAVVLPDVYEDDVKDKTFTPQLVLCGDINQLGPNVVSDLARAAELEVSLLERLFDRPLYSNYMRDVHTQLSVDNKRLPPYTTLVKNYRSHPVILMPPSALFYNDTLQPSARVNGTVAWAGLRTPSMPLKFVGTDASDRSNDDRASWFNPGQINAVVEVIKGLLDNPRQSNPPMRAAEIGVMAPWRQQVWALRKRLRNEGLGAVDVGTIEDYQGRESRVVIISCVRSSERFLEEDHKKGMGLILQRKRMNVAITRAKELLVVVGKGTLLKRDPYWKSFLQFCVRNGLYEGPELDLDMDGNYISLLESTLIHSGSTLLDPEVEGLMIAGGVAREALRE